MLTLYQLIQILVMDSASYKMLKFYIYITNSQVYDIINWLNKNLKMHFVLYLYKGTSSDIETWSKKPLPYPFLILVYIYSPSSPLFPFVGHCWRR